MLQVGRFIRAQREIAGFKWLLLAYTLAGIGLFFTLWFVFVTFLSAHELQGMNSTYALIVENIPIPDDIDSITPAMRHRLQQNATLITFTAGGEERSVMVSTQPVAMQGSQVLIWYNAATFGNVILDDNRNFQAGTNMLAWGVVMLAVGIVLIGYDRRFKAGRLKPIERPGLGGGRHMGRE